jgi:UDP-N-acetylglucosamine 2-epimerase (non-hydrolysing)/GDP/UDP-N,N'-diacetylbacillosamine 2-epimerase (hydrolysing)
MHKRLIAFFTGNRAEYGLQKPIIQAVKEHQELDYRLIVSGAHLDSNFGQTIVEIKSDGFEIEAEAKIPIIPIVNSATSISIGYGVIEISKILEKLKPDFFVVYADRFEGLAAVIASTQMNIPTAHIEGGDLTEGGALDDSVRHAMTKLAHIHFTTNSDSSNRIIGLGEEPWRVHTVGFPAIDLIESGDFASIDELKSRFSLDIEAPIVLFTQHSVTTEPEDSKRQIKESLVALEKLHRKGVQLIITYPNNDMGSIDIISELEAFAKDRDNLVWLIPSLGRRNYHGILALARDLNIRIACAGNSSSGIKETPAFGCPTVNIGSRQDSRLRAKNVITVPNEAEAIFEAIEIALFDSKFRYECAVTENPYYLGGASKKIAEVLASVSIDTSLLRKKMTY